MGVGNLSYLPVSVPRYPSFVASLAPRAHVLRPPPLNDVIHPARCKTFDVIVSVTHTSHPQKRIKKRSLLGLFAIHNVVLHEESSQNFMNRFHYGCVGGRRRRRRRAERSGSYSTKNGFFFFVLGMGLSVVRVGVDGLLCHTNDGG